MIAKAHSFMSNNDFQHIYARIRHRINSLKSMMGTFHFNLIDGIKPRFKGVAPHRFLNMLFGWMLLFMWGHSFAQQQVTNIGTDLGLSVPLVSQTHIDSSQHVWLATMGQGLLWWNGNAFVAPFSDNALEDLYVLQIASHGDSLLLLTERFLVFYDGFQYTHHRLPSERFVRMRIDKDDVFLISQRSGLWQFKDEQISLLCNPTPHLRYSDVWRFDEYTWWFATSDGVWSVDNDTVCAFLRGYNVRRFYASPKDEVFAATTSGLHQLNEKQSTPILNIGDVRDVVFHNAQMYVGTDDFGVTWVIKGDSAGTLLSERRIRSLAFDEANRLWFTSSDGMGVLQNLKESAYLSEDVVFYRGLRTSDGNIWLTGNTGWFAERQQDTIYGNLEPGVVFAITEDLYGNVIMAGESGIDIRASSGERIAFLYEVLPDPFITSMTVMQDALFLGCASGVYRINNYLGNAPTVKQLYTHGVSHVMENAGNIAALTYGLGIVVMQGDGEPVLHHSEFADSSAFGLLPSSLAIDDSGYYWLATTNTGAFIETNSGWHHFNLDGDVAIYHLYSVGERRMLAVTENHLRLIDASTSPPSVYSHPYESQLPAGFQDRASPFAYHDGLVYLTSSYGKHIVDVESFYQPLDAGKYCTPSVWRMDVFFDTHTRWHDRSGSLTRNTGVPKGVTLPHNENYLRFLYGAPKMPLLSSHLEYRYRMHPLDPEWIQSDGVMEAVYTNIPPGTYRFDLEARWPNGDWSAAEQVHFTITPPWYNTWWFYALVIMMLIAMVYALFRYRTRQINERMALQNAVLANERIALRLQMNPHFLFNALESIGSFILKNDTKSTLKYLNSFTKLMRLTLEAGTDKDHPVESEISLLQSYVVLEQLRFGHKFDVVFDVDDEIDYNIAIPPMLVQPHVENAIIHGLRDLEGRRGVLQVRFLIEDDALKVEVEDNGVGRDINRKHSRKAHRSMALEINRKRIDLLSKSFHRTFSLNIIDLYNNDQHPLGTKVIITLPIIYLDDL